MRCINSTIGITFVLRYGADIIHKPENDLDRSLDDEDSNYNPDDDNTNTYDSNYESNYDHDLDPSIAGVYPNNPINNHPPQHQQQ